MEIRFAEAEDLSRVEAFYDMMKYRGGVLASDLVLVADNGRDIIAVVQLCEESGEWILRGMYIREDYQRRGLGTEMLHQLEGHLRTRRCWCVPFSHLTGFYGQVDFHPVDSDEAPRFLRDRLAGYQRQGMDVTLMVRSSEATSAPPDVIPETIADLPEADIPLRGVKGNRPW